MRDNTDIALPSFKPWVLALAGAIPLCLLGYWFIRIDCPIAVPGYSAGGGLLFCLGLICFFAGPAVALVGVAGVADVYFERRKERRQND